MKIRSHRNTYRPFAARGAGLIFAALLVARAADIGSDQIGLRATVWAADHTTDKVDFVGDIQPILSQHCQPCHGVQLQESNYRLDVRRLALAAGDLGEPPIVPGDSDASPLYRYISGQDENGMRMPPPEESRALSRQQVALIKRWIDQGARWPDSAAGDDNLDQTLASDHWSLQPVIDRRPPAAADPWVYNGLDGYIFGTLRDHELSPSSTADRVTLLRRIYLDMHGLPPSEQQLDAFLNDTSDTAWQRVIEQVLASPRYGERWAQHWLDIVRFGESTGFEVNRDRENAYFYRDYVIDALNADKSYRDFVIEQLAGDAIGVDAATGFLVAGPSDLVKSPDINLTLMQREDELADFVNTTGTAFLGLTVGCARCHNHKFDPIIQKDYYALQAVFAGVQHGERALRERVSDATRNRIADLEHELHVAETAWESRRRLAESATIPAVAEDELLPPVNPRSNVEEFDPVAAKFVRFAIRATTASEPCIDELEIFSADGRNVALASSGAVPSASGTLPNYDIHRLEHVNDGRFGNSHSWISNTNGTGWVQIEFPQVEEICRIGWGRDREGVFSDRLATDYMIDVAVTLGQWQTVASSAKRQPYQQQSPSEDAFIASLSGEEAIGARRAYDELKQLREQLQIAKGELPVGYVGTFTDPPKIRRLYRGDPLAPREEVGPDALSVIGTLELPENASDQERRLALAKWIASPSNPLTARVIVNRVWHYHFGTGIVATPSDFGRNGAPPSHPELLDYLASQFIANGWSLKWLHREILSSHTYQQSGTPRSDAMRKDAGCRLLWRFPPRRLEAEAIRDCVLFATGALNLKAGGPGFSLFRIDHENVHHYFPLEEFGPNEFRRMIYALKIRQERDDVFGVFDCPDGGQVMPNRSRSTTPLQALNLLNSPFMLQQASLLADRIRNEAEVDDLPRQVQRAFRCTLLRNPDPDESLTAAELCQQHGLDALCRALLNSNEFLFLP